MRSFTFFVLAFDLRGWEETGLEMVSEGGEGLFGFDSMEKGEGKRNECCDSQPRMEQTHNNLRSNFPQVMQLSASGSLIA